MFYRDVNSSAVMPISSTDVSVSIDPIESFFVDYFFKQGHSTYQEYKSSFIQSNSTFLRDLFNNFSSTIKNKNLDEKQRIYLGLIISSIQNQLLLLEEIIGNIDPETLNAVIAGTVNKHIKKYFS
jgi:ABC-type uncharacterized transport system ATPase component